MWLLSIAPQTLAGHLPTFSAVGAVSSPNRFRCFFKKELEIILSYQPILLIGLLATRKLKFDEHHKTGQSNQLISRGRFQCFWQKGAAHQWAPPTMKPNNFPDEHRQVVYLPPHDER